jgi:hypothetical protein
MLLLEAAEAHQPLASVCSTSFSLLPSPTKGKFQTENYHPQKIFQPGMVRLSGAEGVINYGSQ